MATMRHLSMLIAVLLTCSLCATSASVINDVNNMLRDARTQTADTRDGRMVNAHGKRNHGATATATAMATATETQQMLRNLHNNDDTATMRIDNDNDNDDNLIAEQSSVELLRFVNDDDSSNVGQAISTVNVKSKMAKLHAANTLDLSVGDSAGEGDSEHNLSLNDQVRLLTKQLNALTTRRREDYEMLEHNLRKSLRINNDAANDETDIRNEVEQLRHEVQTLRDGHLNGNKERLTIEWLQQTVAEIRKEVIDLQHVAGNAAKDMQSRSQGYEDLATIRNDFQQIKLELNALRERQEKSEVYVQELREEMIQQEEDFRRLSHNCKRTAMKTTANVTEAENATATATATASADVQQNISQDLELSLEPLADHTRRHCRFQHQQIHELQLAQRGLRRQLNELKYHRIGERVRSIEIEQHRIANANFNLSRQIASLDKLHTSMLELLEDVESLQNKVDKSVPELRHEISKLEFANAQISAEQSLVREEGKNAARTLQAMAVSVSALQDERDGVKEMEATVALLRTNVDRLQTLVDGELQHKKRMHDKPNRHNAKKTHKHAHQQQAKQTQLSREAELTNADITQAETLVAELENVETQYESIINKLPQDCSEVATSTDGLHLIAPAGQHRPLMTHCSADGWTTVQRRFDGSADFNRSWADYAQGFGAPAGEFWIGNEQLHHLTLNNCTQLRVVMQDIYDNVWVADYGRFYISSRADGYRLNIADYSGNASDALNYQQGMQFSAIDDDRDISQTHCAANYEGGWWFSHCQHANLNGRYNLGLTWFDAARNEWIAVKSSQMLVKRQSAAVCAFANTVQAKTAAAASTPAAVVVPVPLASTSTSSGSVDAAQAATATPSTSPSTDNVVFVVTASAAAQA